MPCAKSVIAKGHGVCPDISREFHDRIAHWYTSSSKEHLSFTGEDSAMANLTLSDMDAFTQFEHSLIRERQREGVALIKQRGVYRAARNRFPTWKLPGFGNARQWASAFVHWYNHDHRHNGIRYVSPAQRHVGADRDILRQRHALYCQARERNPRRWSGNTRNWTPCRYAQSRARRRRRSVQYQPRSPVNGCMSQATTTLTCTDQATASPWCSSKLAVQRSLAFLLQRLQNNTAHFFKSSPKISVTNLTSFSSVINTPRGVLSE